MWNESFKVASNTDVTDITGLNINSYTKQIKWICLIQSTYSMWSIDIDCQKIYVYYIGEFLLHVDCIIAMEYTGLPQDTLIPM